MDAHQKISIGIFGALLLGTMAVYTTGGLSSSALNSDALVNTDSLCPDTYMRDYAETYPLDKAKIVELQDFVDQNCTGEVLESKKMYCEARAKQIKTYSKSVERYDTCIGTSDTTKK